MRQQQKQRQLSPSSGFLPHLYYFQASLASLCKVTDLNRPASSTDSWQEGDPNPDSLLHFSTSPALSVIYHKPRFNLVGLSGSAENPCNYLLFPPCMCMNSHTHRHMETKFQLRSIWGCARFHSVKYSVNNLLTY